MRTSLAFLFLFALFFTTVPAVTTFDDVWEVDESCDEHRQELDAAFNDVREMVIAARRDLFRIQERKPGRKSSGPLGDANWDRIARNMAVTFGLTPPADPFENGFDIENEHFIQVNYTIGRLWGGIVQGDDLPEGGYSTRLDVLNRKPLFMCGEEPWEYFARQDNSPDDASMTIEEVLPQTRERFSDGTDKYDGAWVYKSRFEPAKKDLGKIICRPGAYGITQQKLDLITFCDDVFTMGDYKSAVHNADDITTGYSIDDRGIGQKSIARVMLHEFAHYYGTKSPANENNRLSDKDAVDKNGCVVYHQPRTPKYVRDDNDEFNPGQKLRAAKVYGMPLVASIARDNSNNPNFGKYRRTRNSVEWLQCSATGPSGPAVAPYTAETYAYFGILSYLDKWDLTPDGVAKTLPQ